MGFFSLVGNAIAGKAIDSAIDVVRDVISGEDKDTSQNDPNVKTLDFESLLRESISANDKNMVSEEALFASLTGERIKTLKGEEAFEQFKSALESKKSLNTKGTFIGYEASTKAALQELREQGVLTSEETDKIYSEAFSAAQLDGDTEALWDDRGGASDPTVAMDSLENAINASKLKIEAFDSGAEQALIRSVDEPSASGPGQSTFAGTIYTGTTYAPTTSVTNTPDGNTFDGQDGFLFKPIADHGGKLTILVPPEIWDHVESVTLKDEAGNEIERGTSAGVGSKGIEQKYNFTKPGAEYQDNLKVEILIDNGTVLTYLIPNPGERYD